MSELFSEKSTHRVLVRDLRTGKTKTITIHGLDMSLEDLKDFLMQKIVMLKGEKEE